MRNSLFQHGVLLLAAAATLIGCKDDDTDKLRLPTVEITEIGTSDRTVEFAITASGADECAYVFDTEEKIGEGIPDAETIFAEGERVDLSTNAVISKPIAPGTQYVVFAAAKNAAGYGKVGRCDLNVPNLVGVEVSDITKSSFTFTVSTDGDRAYKYVTMPARYLEQVYEVQEAVTDAEKNMAAMRYLAWYGFKDNGTKSFTHTDNETYTDVDDGEYIRELIAGMDYVVLAVGYGADDKFSGKVAIAEFSMAESDTPTGNVEMEVNTGIISANVKCTPDDNVLYYKALLMKKANRDAYIAEHGQASYDYEVANNDNSRRITGVDEYQWKNLSADTEYVMSFVIIDKEHNAKWEDREFRTKQADEQSADIILTGSVGDTTGYYDDWNSLSFNVKSEAIVLPSKYFFGYTSLVTRLMNQGYSLEEIADVYGESFSQYNINNINGENGCDASFTEILKPDVSYTYIVALTNANGKTGIKSMELRTAKRIVEPLSQSPLFEELAGEWSVVVPVQEYDWQTGSYNNYEYRFDITIGNDDEFGDLCRSYNWLMCKGWAGLEYKSPDDLRNDPQYDGFYKEVPENIFYNFGPKWFFEIDADGNVTVPTKPYVPSLMNYDENAPAARLASVSSYIGSDPLPVEVADDKNTITIKPYTSGWSGPAYLMLVDEGSYMAPKAKTSGDIVLTRK